MKKRMLSILLLCCMVLTLLPTAAFAAGELPDVKFSVPTTFDKTVDLTKQNKELKIKDSKTYLIKGSADPNWYFQYRIKIDGKNNTPHIFLDGVRLQAPEDGPAIELYGGASACLYFIGRDSELIGAENFAALQKNKTEGYLRVLVQTGTKLTCQGGRYGAGIGGSKVGIKKFSQGHGMNLHFGSLATNIYGGEILAVSGVYGAGIGGGQGGVGEWIYVYSGKLTVRSVSEGAGIGGGQGGPGRFIYIKGGTVNAGSESGGAGIGSGDQDGQNKSEDAHHIEISGGTVEAWSNYAGAGIGGGRGGSGYDISITGGVVRAQGYYGAGIGGGMNGDSGNILIKDTTLTALAFPLYPSSDYTERSASAVGRGSNWVHYMTVIQDQEFAMTREENIKIEASDGKSVRLSATGWQWRPNQGTNKLGWGTTTELLIGCVDLQRLSLPYAYNYGRVISELELRCEESTCSHEFGWVNRDGCHIWACVNCGARDPAAEMSKQNAKHIPGDWGNQKQLCTVCGHVMGTDTKAPVLEGLKDGESYTVEDNIDGNPGAYTFTVSDPAASGETSSGIKSVTINGEPQDGPTYRLPAPDGGNNDAGAEYTVVATDNAGNETTATVRTYRWHHTVTFDANGGSEPEDLPEEVTTAMPDKKVLHGSEYYLPECEFIAPEGKQFKAWQIDGTEYPVNDPVTVTADITAKALWEDAPPSHEHSYGDWSRDGTNHWHECTDDDCPNREESINDKAAHVYTDDADTTCDVCGYERTVTPPSHEHSYGDWRKDGTNHWHECTDADCPNREESIKDKAAHVYTDDADTTCDTCGYERTITPPAHEHRYGDWRKDGTNHWHECTDADCPNREESIKDKAAHVYTDDADTTCDTCGYERTITPPAHEHRYGDWRKDGTNHWHECTDADCPNREESIKDKAAHVYTDDADTTCDTCGYERTITPPAHEHRYGDWRKDGTNHWHECTDDDCPDREESIKDKAAHVYTDDADTTCDTCGYERTITPPAHEHRYGDWRKDGTNHWHECTDADCPNREESIKDKAAHVYTDDADTTCDTCGYERTIMPPAHEHRYGDWRKDGTNHWHECTDADCPNRNESITDKAAHVYTDDADTTCNVCGYERTVTPPAHEHIVTFDGNGGTSSVGSMTTTNQKLTSLPSASRSGSYSFDGWYTEKSGGTKITTDTVFSANTTVYAHWTYTGGGGGGYNPPVTYYTLRFETGGGSDIPSVREAYNTYIDLTKYVPTWRGHTFIGWYTERSLMNKVSGVYLTKDMTVYAGWRVDENPGTGANPFTDVSEKDWFYSDVMFVYENGLMLGTSKTLFSPHGTATRGMMATILWRMEGSPAPKGKNSFTDVEAEKWYADAITWTAENDIFAGYGKDKFGPDDPITREQLAAIFYRYADYKGYDLTVKGNLDKFKDADKITDYAKTAMQWAVGSGLMKGKSGNLLDPQGTATRAEIAAMLHRFIEKYELVQGKAPGGLMGWIDPKRLQIPKTGDNSVLGLWGFSLCTSLAGCLALTTWQIRRRREEESLQIIEK